MVKENEKHHEVPGDPNIHSRQWGWAWDSEKEGGGGHHACDGVTHCLSVGEKKSIGGHSSEMSPEK